MKLNPEKCVFGVKSGKFLGFMVSQRGIEANPDKIRAIINMEPPKTLNEVQKLKWVWTQGFLRPRAQAWTTTTLLLFKVREHASALIEIAEKRSRYPN